MDSAVLSPVPGVRAVAGEQLRAVGLSLRREAMVAAGFLGLASAWMAQLEIAGHSARISFSPDAGVPAAILALLVPMAVWKGEGPGRRGYHRAMPVGHASHAVLRTLSGWAWTMAAVAAYFLWLALAAWFTGGATFAGGVMMSTVTVPAYRWAVPFVAGTVLYLLGSALTILTSHPWRWLGGAVVATLFSKALAAGSSRSVFEMITAVVDGRYGLYTLVTGRSRLHDIDYGFALTSNAPVWFSTAWLWLAIAVVAFAFATWRQPEG